MTPAHGGELYLLTRVGGAGWDETRGLVVRAKHASHARALAQRACDEHVRVWSDRRERYINYKVWTNPKYSTLETIDGSGEFGVVLQDLQAG
jgi:hypothetical protein